MSFWQRLEVGRGAFFKRFDEGVALFGNTVFLLTAALAQSIASMASKCPDYVLILSVEIDLRCVTC